MQKEDEEGGRAPTVTSVLSCIPGILRPTPTPHSNGGQFSRAKGSDVYLQEPLSLRIVDNSTKDFYFCHNCP